MSNRTVRREAERLARKLAYQQLRQQPLQQPAAEPETSAISEAQLAANRANAQLSTGPVTPEGRAKSSQNALKYALTGNTVLLPDDDAAQYQHELDMHLEIHRPVGTEELRIVHSLLDCNWRLKRILRIETSILYKGQIEAAEKFPANSNAHPEVERRHLINAEAYLVYEKQLRNLYIQEARIRRTMDKLTAELIVLQTKRQREQQAALGASAPSASREARIKSAKSAKTAPPAPNGFEFASQPNTPPAATHPDQKQHESAA